MFLYVIRIIHSDFSFWVSYNLILKTFPNNSTAYNLAPHKILKVLHFQRTHFYIKC